MGLYNALPSDLSCEWSLGLASVKLKINLRLAFVLFNIHVAISTLP